MGTSMVREAVGIFPDARTMQGAVDDLLIKGLDRSFLSLMATPRTVERELGQRFERASARLDRQAGPSLVQDVAARPRSTVGLTRVKRCHCGRRNTNMCRPE
jgi:hypothetical protein